MSRYHYFQTHVLIHVLQRGKRMQNMQSITDSQIKNMRSVLLSKKRKKTSKLFNYQYRIVKYHNIFPNMCYAFNFYNTERLAANTQFQKLC